jgi:hypothetical protein
MRIVKRGEQVRKRMERIETEVVEGRRYEGRKKKVVVFRLFFA